ncbi:MAG: xanthine dehydrogenase family protein subunit M [Gemmatimonadota bacterium]|nr:xanthine dehydrogenase family protein subunit M [Gemmatimonadota bacterium]
MLPQFGFVRAQTLDEAFAQLEAADTRVSAGGSDLLGCLRDGVFDCAKVVSLSRLDALRGIAANGGGLRIGALARIAEVAANPTVNERYAVLAQAAGAVASPQLRNQGTIGGNLCQKPRCWYYRGEFHCKRKGGDTCYALAGENQFHCILGGQGCYIVHPSDTAPALVALGATVRIASREGTRTVPIEEFHVSPRDDVQRETVLRAGEVVTAIDIPAPPRGLRSSYRKVRARGSWDFALAGVALALQFDGTTVTGGRVALSGVAPVPWRARAVEQAIMGQALTPEVAERAGAAAVEGAAPLKRNGYKVPLVRNVVREALLAI